RSPRYPGTRDAHALLHQPLRAAARGPRLPLHPAPARGLTPPLTRLGRCFVQPRANERSTRPLRGLGANEVDLRGTFSPCAATSRTMSAEIGGQMTPARSGGPAPPPTASP